MEVGPLDDEPGVLVANGAGASGFPSRILPENAEVSLSPFGPLIYTADGYRPEMGGDLKYRRPSVIRQNFGARGSLLIHTFLIAKLAFGFLGRARIVKVPIDKYYLNKYNLIMQPLDRVSSTSHIQHSASNILFDSHTHIHFPVYDDDRDEVIERAQKANIKMITVGTQLTSSQSAIKLAEQYPGDIWATVGFHPSHTVEKWYHDPNEQDGVEPEKFDIAQLSKLAEHPRVVAIGECGLDYYRLVDENSIIKDKNIQAEIFFKQAELADKLQKPLMIHCRPSKGSDDAYEDLLETMGNLETSRIIHFYVGSIGITKGLLEAGFYFTFGGVITFSKDYDEVIKYIPLDRILLETDAPYVAPAFYRGKRNEPVYIIETAKRLAEIKNTTYEEVVKATVENNEKIFRLHPTV